MAWPHPENEFHPFSDGYFGIDREYFRAGEETFRRHGEQLMRDDQLRGAEFMTSLLEVTEREFDFGAHMLTDFSHGFDSGAF
ncbi:hypothetical protein [Crossiella cryophila]|uniref:Uncharacterized protein n=1 Tax=Crossiella cryophila TaxID=43355 RepID=A0A7W7CIW7_9PSEU|nr:hypothetical protein [Crossiella cryophila]MBB4681797.1 hypothetical protein [Crossiella cryophila]